MNIALLDVIDERCNEAIRYSEERQQRILKLAFDLGDHFKIHNYNKYLKTSDAYEAARLIVESMETAGVEMACRELLRTHKIEVKPEQLPDAFKRALLAKLDWSYEIEQAKRCIVDLRIIQ